MTLAKEARARSHDSGYVCVSSKESDLAAVDDDDHTKQQLFDYPAAFPFLKMYSSDQL